jgi:dimethylglycine dehydrogenase
VTSGAWGYRVGKNLAYAFVKPEVADGLEALEIDMLGERVAAKIIPASPYDAKMERVRS